MVLEVAESSSKLIDARLLGLPVSGSAECMLPVGSHIRTQYICIHAQTHRSIQAENGAFTSIHLNTQHSDEHEQHRWSNPVPILEVIRILLC